MTAWNEALAGATSIALVVQIANEFLAMMPRDLRRLMPAGVLPQGIGSEDDIHYCHRALARAYPASAINELDPDIGRVSAFFLQASAKCMALSGTRAAGNSAAFRPGLQVTSSVPHSPRGKRGRLGR